MKNLRGYYNSDEWKSLTYLEFGAIDLKSSQKQVYDFRLHDEAYDLFMLARYMKDLIAFRDLLRSEATLADKLEAYECRVHTRDLYNTFSKLAALNVLKIRDKRRLLFTELGSTLMGAIEALEFVKREGNSIDPEFTTVDLVSDVSYLGIDISDLLNDVAKELHRSYDFRTVSGKAEFTGDTDLFFAKGVSILYAIQSVRELVDLLSRAEVSSFDYSFSLVEPHEVMIGSGKNVQYLNVVEFVEEFSGLDSELELFMEEGSITMVDGGRRVRFNGYFGNKAVVEDVITEEARLKSIFGRGLVERGNAGTMFWEHREVSGQSRFITSHEFIEGHVNR